MKTLFFTLLLTLTFIPICICFCVSIVTSPTPALAVHQIPVTNDKAIIYADRNLQIPIGIVKKGHMITIGNPSSVTPSTASYAIIVEGKIAYIKKEDVLDEKLKDNDQEKYQFPVHPKKDEKANFNLLTKKNEMYQNDFFLSYQRLSTNSGTNMFSLYLHNWPKNFWAITTGFDYLFHSSNDSSISAFGLAAGITINAYQFKYVDLLLIAIFHYFPIYKLVDYTDADFETEAETEYKGTASGYNLGIHLTYPFSKKFDLRLGLNYFKLNIASLEESGNPQNITTETSKQTLSILLGIAYLF
ncbi:MAG: hypothetical protein HQK49_03710 [Oligoflexia bacterium]|nr:hypothetical protein [Oligoflexia bacterium]